jgi:4-amino-4-deoxy-L-arabinose transferase-like glycosyltransferase
MEVKALRYIGIILILILSVLLHFLWLGQEGLANLYYAAGVKSMMLNWYNFFFVAFDPGGFITIDKPPLGFWLQTISAKVFGFQGWSIIFPQAVSGVIAVYLIYLLVNRYHGQGAGLIAALVLAVTPIFVAASRNNTIDVLLVTTVLFAVLVFLPATEELSLKKLLMAFFLIGVGFNIKSLEAFMVLPAFYITYLFTQQGHFKKKAVHLLAATVVLIVSSLPWFIAVDSIAPEDRPYVGSSTTNSELELATGYNGLSHFLRYGNRTPGRPGQRLPLRVSAAGINGSSVTPSAGTRQQGGETGLAGPFRLFNHQMGGQISWLLSFALIGLIIALVRYRQQALTEKIKMKLLFWGCWLLPQAIFFSIAQGAHRYYLVMMAPAIAALVGISYSTLVIWSTGFGKKRYLLPAAILVTIGVQAFIIAGYNEWHSWMLPLVMGVGVLAVILLGWQAKNGRIQPNKYHSVAVVLGGISLLIAPFVWSLTPVLYGSGNAAFPFAGPDLNTQLQPSNISGGRLNLSGRFTVDMSKLETFLVSHKSGEKYLVAVPNAHNASPIILETGEPVITYGGFMGSEKILNGEKLEQLVRSGQVRYILIGSGNGQQPEVDEWVRSHGILVPDGEWQTKSEQQQPIDEGPNRSRRMPLQLYECQLSN